MITEQQIKAIKKRGQYFYNAIDIPMAKKYNISPVMVNEIREFAIYKKKTQPDICIQITNALQSGVYETINTKPTKYGSKEKLIKARTELLHLLLRLSPEAFADIAQLTKYDFDYQGEDKKVPSREEYREYLKSLKLAGERDADVPV